MVGSIAITKSNDKVAQLRWFVLDENYHGMGIGKKLMETAIDFCEKQRYKHVFLSMYGFLLKLRTGGEE